MNTLSEILNHPKIKTLSKALFEFEFQPSTFSEFVEIHERAFYQLRSKLNLFRLEELPGEVIREEILEFLEAELERTFELRPKASNSGLSRLKLFGEHTYCVVNFREVAYGFLTYSSAYEFPVSWEVFSTLSEACKELDGVADKEAIKRSILKAIQGGIDAYLEIDSSSVVRMKLIRYHKISNYLALVLYRLSTGFYIVGKLDMLFDEVGVVFSSKSLVSASHVFSEEERLIKEKQNSTKSEG